MLVIRAYFCRFKVMDRLDNPGHGERNQPSHDGRFLILPP